MSQSLCNDICQDCCWRGRCVVVVTHWVSCHMKCVLLILFVLFVFNPSMIGLVSGIVCCIGPVQASLLNESLISSIIFIIIHVAGMYCGGAVLASLLYASNPVLSSFYYCHSCPRGGCAALVQYDYLYYVNFIELSCLNPSHVSYSFSWCAAVVQSWLLCCMKCCCGPQVSWWDPARLSCSCNHVICTGVVWQFCSIKCCCDPSVSWWVSSRLSHSCITYVIWPLWCMKSCCAPPMSWWGPARPMIHPKPRFVT